MQTPCSPVSASLGSLAKCYQNISPTSAMACVSAGLVTDSILTGRLGVACRWRWSSAQARCVEQGGIGLVPPCPAGNGPHGWHVLSFHPFLPAQHICSLAWGECCWSPTEVGFARLSSPAAAQWKLLAAEVRFCRSSAAPSLLDSEP